jgi:hypothetical protein
MVAGLARVYADNRNLQKIIPYDERLKRKIIITIEQ